MSTACAAMNGASTTMPTVPIIAPAKCPIAAAASACDPRPSLAILLPSMAVTTAALSPGVFSRIEVVEPPNMPP
jgi:hypothetical protein